MRNTKNNIGLYLLLVLVLWAFCFVTLKLWLMPYSAAYAETGTMTAGYFFYAAIGLLFSTPAPFISAGIISLCREHIGTKEFFCRIFRTESKTKTILLTGGFCLSALIYALINGSPNGTAWYMLPLGFLVMIPFVGIAEETGWRGFLQPALEKRLPFPVSVLAVAAIWYVWHLDLWLDPTSNHYGDSLLGFGITILIWAFAEAALYRSTKSVIACAVYHAFIDALGAVWDWNLLFDSFPGNAAANIYRAVWLALSLGLWALAVRKDRQKITGSTDESGTGFSGTAHRLTQEHEPARSQ